MIGGLKLFSALQRLIFYYTCRLQFAINVFLSSFTAGLYVVTKGNSLSLFFCFYFSPDQCLESMLTPDNDLSISGLGYSCASSSQGTLQIYVFFYGVLRGKVCILKGFSRLIVGFDVQ